MLTEIDATNHEIFGLLEFTKIEGKILNYEQTKISLLKLFKQFLVVTNNECVCPLRENHQLTVVGKGLDFKFNDDLQEVWVRFKIVDDKIWTKVEDNILNDLAVGGNVVHISDESYSIEVSEISLISK